MGVDPEEVLCCLASGLQQEWREERTITPFQGEVG